MATITIQLTEQEADMLRLLSRRVDDVCDEWEEWDQPIPIDVDRSGAYKIALSVQDKVEAAVKASRTTT